MESSLLGINDYTINGECSKCGECCSNLLPLFDSDIKAIKKYIKDNHIEPVNHTPPFAKGPVVDCVCPFLSFKTTDKCLIYPVRPRVCRDFICHNPKLKLYKAKYTIVDVRRIFYEE